MHNLLKILKSAEILQDSKENISVLMKQLIIIYSACAGISKVELVRQRQGENGTAKKADNNKRPTRRTRSL